MVQVQDLTKDFLFPTRTGDSRFSLDYLNNLNEFDGDTNNGVSSESSLVYVTQPVFKRDKVDAFIECTQLLGGLQSFNISEAQQIIKVKEIGSRLCRDVGGTPQYGLNLSRLLTIHSNLKAALYQWIVHIAAVQAAGGQIDLTLPPAAFDQAKPHLNKHFVGLESPLFRVPFGILHVKVTPALEVVSIEMAERCHLVAGGSGQTAGSPIVVDNWSCTVTRVIPLLRSDGKDAIIHKFNNSQNLTAFTLT